MPEITRMCDACAIGLYEECENPTTVWSTTTNGEYIIPCFYKFDVLAPVVTSSGGGGSVGGQPKDGKEVKDILSTGRKRAAMLMPIMQGMFCDWAGLKWAGGGAHPIVGCKDTRLAPVKSNDDLPEGNYSRGELHHGPDKSVLNNAVGRNLHAICSSCHHRWHALNDDSYEGGRPNAAHLQWVPAVPYYGHSFTEAATDEDYEASEAWWALDKSSRGAFPVEPPPERFLLQPEEQGILTGDNPFEEPLTPFTENGE